MGTREQSGKPDEMLGVTCDGLASHPGGRSNTSSCFIPRNYNGISSGGVNPLARVQTLLASVDTSFGSDITETLRSPSDSV